MKKFAITAGIAALGTFALPAIVTFNLNTIYTGATPGGIAPLVTITIADIAANKVNVQVDHNASSASGQFISNVYLNLNPFVGSIVVSNEVNSNKRDGFSNALNGVNGAAGNNFDMEISFETSNSGGGLNRLKPGELWSGDLTGAGLSATNFLATSDNGLSAGAHLQGIAGGLSSHVGVVPEPATMFGIAMGIAAIASKRRRK